MALPSVGCRLLERHKFDPNLTQRDTLSTWMSKFKVPVDMMQALACHWFLLEQPEIQVTLDYSGWAWVLGGGKGTVQLWATTGLSSAPHLPCSLVTGAGGSEKSRWALTQRD